MPCYTRKEGLFEIDTELVWVSRLWYRRQVPSCVYRSSGGEAQAILRPQRQAITPCTR